jgi:U4/U6 small nuclear ribonucleoprotein PRP31
VVELAKMPSSNVLVLGSQRVNLEGFSTAGKLHMGFLSELEEIQKTPENHKKQILRKYAGKAVLMARIDAYRIPNIKNEEEHNSMLVDESDNFQDENFKLNSRDGEKFKEEITKKMSKIIEPHQAIAKKPLPKPDDKPRRKRGGKRMRSIKERYSLTEMRSMKNRMKFGAEAEVEFRQTGKGFGLLGIGGNGSKIKTTVKNQKINTKKQRLLALESHQNNNIGSTTSGLHSSVSFTPVEGIELINPELLEKRYSNVKDKYFSSTSGFNTVISQKKKSNSNTLYEI